MLFGYTKKKKNVWDTFLSKSVKLEVFQWSDPRWVNYVDAIMCCTSNGRLCQCGGAKESHLSVALGDYFSTAMVNHWDSSQHSSEYATDAFGELQFAGSSKRQSYVGTRLSGAGWLSAWLESYMSVWSNRNPTVGLSGDVPVCLSVSQMIVVVFDILPHHVFVVLCCYCVVLHCKSITRCRYSK